MSEPRITVKQHVGGKAHEFECSSDINYCHVYARSDQLELTTNAGASYPVRVVLNSNAATTLYETLGKVYGPRPTADELAKVTVLRNELADLMLRRGITEGVDGAIMADVLKILYSWRIHRT